MRNAKPLHVLSSSVSFLLLPIMDSLNFHKTDSVPGSLEGYGLGSFDSITMPNNSHAGSMRPSTNGTFWQMQYQQLQIKYNMLEMDSNSTRRAYMDLGGKLELALKAVEAATLGLEGGLKRIDDGVQKIDDNIKKLTMLRDKMKSTFSTAGSATATTSYPIHPPRRDENFSEKVCWTTEDLDKYSKTAADAAEQPLNKALRFLRHKDGSIIDPARVAVLREHFRQCLNQVSREGKPVPNYGDVGVETLRYIQHEMYQQFPEINYCDDHWKFKRLWQVAYSSWKQSRADLFPPKGRSIKSERTTPALLSHTPTPALITHKSTHPALPPLSITATTRPSLDFSTLIALDSADNPDAVIPAHQSLDSVDSSSLPDERSAATLPPRHSSNKRMHSSENNTSDTANKRQKTDDATVRYKVINPLYVRPAFATFLLIDEARMNVTLIDTGNVISPMLPSDSSGNPPAPASQAGDASADGHASSQGQLGGQSVAAKATKATLPRTKAWVLGLKVTAFNLFAHDCRRKDDKAQYAATKTAWDSIKGNEEYKHYVKRAKDIAKSHNSLDVYFAEVDKGNAGKSGAEVATIAWDWLAYPNFSLGLRLEELELSVEAWRNHSDCLPDSYSHIALPRLSSVRLSQYTHTVLAYIVAPRLTHVDLSLSTEASGDGDVFASLLALLERGENSMEALKVEHVFVESAAYFVRCLGKLTSLTSLSINGYPGTRTLMDATTLKTLSCSSMLPNLQHIVVHYLGGIWPATLDAWYAFLDWRSRERMYEGVVVKALVYVDADVPDRGLRAPSPDYGSAMFDL
ncbi:uncharacterized protein SCHCODRAFT_02664982 [Schizophyllum commune H4-8]|uniref:Uncharacterized protein n=1 Tax=Schizophyllum commune (strain H4-8 / FGSC 9210) TaxID=578458 RepID=D8PYC8_SCHCM|nr:uncharacterized protein SCHCODRAFT_02664982 [Schizophyllum commune H4-8]KAI5897276.1 hypothetical protein SCHCODRAFT_02664982 [Schizophyllum commune H4-8]